MNRKLKYLVKTIFNHIGLDIRRSTPHHFSLQKLFDLYGVEIVFDIGANNGMTGEELRDCGFQHKIVSFEPINYLFEELASKAFKDPSWYVENIALGNVAGQTDINVSGGHAGASSILEMTDNVRMHAPDQQVIRQEKIKIETLDTMMEKYYPAGKKLFLKIDVQGYEKDVLAGGLTSIDRVIGMKVEMSLVQNYEGETLLFDLIPFLYNLGFRLVHFQDGWCNSVSRELYQVDGIFFRTETPLKSLN